MTETIGKNVGLDDSVWNETRDVREGIELSAPHNESATSSQVVGLPSNSQESYEKDARIIQIEQRDPSDYGRGITRDLVGLEIFATAGVNKARAWALCLRAKIRGGLRAAVQALEIDGDNDGEFEPNMDTDGSSYGGVLVGGVTQGNRPLTAMFAVKGGTCGHHRVFTMREDDFINSGSFMTILYQNTNEIKHQIGPDGMIIDGRRVIVRNINGNDCLVLE